MERVETEITLTEGEYGIFKDFIKQNEKQLKEVLKKLLEKANVLFDKGQEDLKNKINNFVEGKSNSLGFNDE